jgi:DNA-binding transcriptional LysR family regulator
MDRFVSMSVFTRVVEERSFIGAARHLRMSPASISAHVRELEERLGVRLLNRTTRSLSLTDVGRTYYDRCVVLLAELEEAESLASALQAAPRGLLRLNTSPGLGVRHVAPAIADFATLHPDMSVELDLTDRPIDLVEEGVDLALRVEPVPESSLIVRQLTPVRMVICAASAYLERRGMPSVPQDLEAHDCLVQSQLPSWNHWHLTGPDGLPRAVSVNGTLRSNSAEALRAAALRGQGLICLPTYLVGEDLIAGRLLPVLSDHAPASTALRALYPHRRHLSAKVRVFVDFLALRFSQDPCWDAWRPVPAPRRPRVEPVEA